LWKDSAVAGIGSFCFLKVYCHISKLLRSFLLIGCDVWKVCSSPVSAAGHAHAHAVFFALFNDHFCIMDPFRRTPAIGCIIQKFCLTCKGYKFHTAKAFVIKFFYRFTKGFICVRTFCQPPSCIRTIFHFRFCKFRFHRLCKFCVSSKGAYRKSQGHAHNRCK